MFLNPASYHQKVRGTAVKTGAVVGFSTENQSRSSSPSEVKLWNAKLMTKEQWGLACKEEVARPKQPGSQRVRQSKKTAAAATAERSLLPGSENG